MVILRIIFSVGILGLGLRAAEAVPPRAPDSLQIGDVRFVGESGVNLPAAEIPKDVDLEQFQAASIDLSRDLLLVSLRVKPEVPVFATAYLYRVDGISAARLSRNDTVLEIVTTGSVLHKDRGHARTVFFYRKAGFSRMELLPFLPVLGNPQ